MVAVGSIDGKGTVRQVFGIVDVRRFGIERRVLAQSGEEHASVAHRAICRAAFTVFVGVVEQIGFERNESSCHSPLRKVPGLRNPASTAKTARL